MPATFTLQLANGPLNFSRIVRLTHVDGERDGKPLVWFDEYDQSLAQERKGVTLVVQDGSKVLFCAENHDRAVAKQWLYGNLGYLYWKRSEAAEVLNAGYRLELYFSSTGDASQLISELRPPWNVLSRGRRPGGR